MTVRRTCSQPCLTDDRRRYLRSGGRCRHRRRGRRHVRLGRRAGSSSEHLGSRAGRMREHLGSRAERMTREHLPNRGGRSACSRDELLLRDMRHIGMILLLQLLLLLQLALSTILLLELHEVLQCLGLVIRPSVRVHLHDLVVYHVCENPVRQAG